MTIDAMDIPFPETIDSSLRSAFAACPRKCFWEYMLHQKPNVPSEHLHAGGAYARGLETTRTLYYGTPSATADVAIGHGAEALIKAYGSFEPPPYSGKTLEGMLSAFDAYFNAWPLESDTLVPYIKRDGKPAVEFTFAVPIPGVNHPDTGNPILYTGRFDMLGVLDGEGGVYVVDDKTTSQLGSSWSKQWTLRAQFSGYVWAAREMGYDVKGAIVRGVSILKTGHGTAQAITYRPTWMLSDWLYSLTSDVRRMIRYWASMQAAGAGNPWDAWPQNLDSACSSYGSCPFMTLCETNDPEEWLPIHYRKEIWNPLTNTTE